MFEGIHKDSGRLMKFIISMDEKHSPSQVISIVKSMDEIQRTVLAFAEAMAASSVSYGQALARIVGCPQYRSNFELPSRFEELKLDHLIPQYPEEQTPIEFEMMHRSKLDPGLSTEDTVYFMNMESAPYFIGDFMKSRPNGEYELAATVRLRDLVWIDAEYFLAGPEYFWHDQYLLHIGTRAEFKARRLETLNRVLYSKVVSGIDSALGEVVRYRFEERALSVDMLAFKESSRGGDEVYIVGPKRWVLAKGMGVVFELPIWITCKGTYLDRLYGSVTGFKRSSDPRYPWNITFRLHLDKTNIPTWLLGRVSGSHLLQTDIQLTISEVFLSAVFSIWPVALFQGSCVPGVSDEHTNDRVVTGHVQISRKTKGRGSDSASGHQVSSGSDSDKEGSISSSLFIQEGGVNKLHPDVDKVLAPLIKLHEGGVFVDVFRVNPLRPSNALACLGLQDELMNQVNPSPLQITCHCLVGTSSVY